MEKIILTWLIVIIGSWSAAVTLRDGRWLLLIVPALALLAALQADGPVLRFISADPWEIVSGILVQAFEGTIVGAAVAGLVRLRPIALGADVFKKTGVVVPALAILGAGLAAWTFNWLVPSNYGPVVGPAALVWLICWLIEARRLKGVEADRNDARFKLAMVGFAVLLALEAQLQLAIEMQTCGPYQCGGRFVGVLDNNPYPFWDIGVLGFLPQPSIDVVRRLIYLPMLFAATLCCAVLLSAGMVRIPRKRAVAIAALAAIAVAYATPTYEYPGWSHYPTPTLGIGL
jgi:hypothetical protein